MQAVEATRWVWLVEPWKIVSVLRRWLGRVTPVASPRMSDEWLRQYEQRAFKT